MAASYYLGSESIHASSLQAPFPLALKYILGEYDSLRDDDYYRSAAADIFIIIFLFRKQPTMRVEWAMDRTCTRWSTIRWEEKCVSWAASVYDYITTSILKCPIIVFSAVGPTYSIICLKIRDNIDVHVSTGCIDPLKESHEHYFLLCAPVMKRRDDQFRQLWEIFSSGFHWLNVLLQVCIMSRARMCAQHSVSLNRPPLSWTCSTYSMWGLVRKGFGMAGNCLSEQNASSPFPCCNENGSNLRLFMGTS